MAQANLVAEYLIHLKNLDKTVGEDFSLSNLKLQKILYYCQGAHYIWDNEQLITDNVFEAWDYGPVIRSVYHKYKKFGQNDIYIDTFSDISKFQKLDRNIQETIEAVWNQLKPLSAYELVEKTHQEAPWRNSMLNNQLFIDEISIKDFFNSNFEVEGNI